MPPASASDNQGLKIAVAIFAALTVILGVATYFGFSQASYYSEKYDSANKDLATAKTAQGELQTRNNEFKDLLGYSKTGEEQVKDQMSKDLKGVGEKLVGLAGKAQQIPNQVNPGGANTGMMQQTVGALTTAAESFANEPGKTMLSSVNRMGEILDNMSNLLALLATDHEATRSELEKMNQVNNEKLKVEIAAKETAEADRLGQLQNHEEDRKSIHSQMTALQDTNQKQATRITELTTQLAQLQEDSQKKANDLLAALRDWRERAQAQSNVLESANGYVTYVDYSRNEVRTTLTRPMGAREQMIFAVFDKNAPGIPSDKPKAKIELIRVDNTGSVGRILEIMDTLAPIKLKDQLYSPAFAARPREWALIGPIDIDGDTKDDREDMKRMIRAAGGEVTYDLPPAGLGHETGKLSPLTDWYVLDTNAARRAAVEAKAGGSGPEVEEYSKKLTKALSEARTSGVQPISIERVLAMLNARYGAPASGVEAIDRRVYQRVVSPQGVQAPRTPPAANGTGDASPNSN